MNGILLPRHQYLSHVNCVLYEGGGGKFSVFLIFHVYFEIFSK